MTYSGPPPTWSGWPCGRAAPGSSRADQLAAGVGELARELECRADMPVDVGRLWRARSAELAAVRTASALTRLLLTVVEFRGADCPGGLGGPV